MTEIYLKRLINRLSVVGGVFLALMACSPFLIAKAISLPQNAAIGGTGIIILVSVMLELIKQLRGRIIQHRFVHKKYTLKQEAQGAL
jgi:preprotein translocase subunit SecY